MKQFAPLALTPASANFRELYPSALSLKETYVNAHANERLGIIRLWMTEGIPFAFKEQPLLYEEIRSFLAARINVYSKDITVVGSARIGFSMSKKEWGRSFNNGSDLDLTIVSNDLYKALVMDFQRWVKDIELRKIQPKNVSEMASWLDNIKYLDGKIATGFIQVRFIPYHRNYITVKKCYDSIWLLKKRLRLTDSAPQVSDASIRVYSSWKACINQLHINLKSALAPWQ